MTPDMKLVKKMSTAAYILRTEVDHMEACLDSAILEFKQAQNPPRYYGMTPQDQGLEMMLDDLDYAHSEYTAAVESLTVVDKQLRTLLELRKEFGEITGFHFEEDATPDNITILATRI